MRFPRKRGSTSVIVRIFIPDSSSTTGAGLTGLTSASTNLTIAYIRELDSAGTAYTGANIEAQTTIGTYQAPSSSSKIRFKPVDATNFPGVYELQFHDSATAFGAGDTSQNVVINVFEASTSALHIGPCMCLIPLVPWDYQDGVRMGLTALPNAAAGANGGLPLSVDSSGRVDVLKVNGTSQTAGDISGKTNSLTFTVSNQLDVNVLDWKSATAPAMTGDAYARLGAPAGASVSADVATVKTDSAAIKLKTDNLPASPAAVGSAMTLTGAYDAAKTAAPESGGNVAAIKAKTDNLPANPAAALTDLAEVNVKKINGATVLGTGISSDKWRGS